MSQIADTEVLQTLKECSDELAEWVDAHYQYTLHHPSEKRRYDRDMEPVVRARTLLARISQLRGE